jgi:hypothetical protein
MIGGMEFTTANVVLFAFHDSARASQIVAAACDQTGVRSVAVVARSTDCEIRIISRVGEELTQARWLASVLAVLDGLAEPLHVLSGSTCEAGPVTLPDSDDGFATFGRLIPNGTLVILVVVCDESELAIGPFAHRFGAALLGMPAACGIGRSVDAQPWRGTRRPRTAARIVRSAH